MAQEKEPFETLSKIVSEMNGAVNNSFIDIKKVENVLRDLLKKYPANISDAEFKKEADVSFVQKII